MPTHTKFKGVKDISDSLLCDNLESNMIQFFNWGMLCIGGFNDVIYGNASGAFGGDMSQLTPMKDVSYLDGQVWQGFRQDWVWESGVEYNTQPIPISGVWVNNIFYSSNDSQYSFHIDYPGGRIIFDNPLPITTKVNASYSYRDYTIQSSDTRWFRQIMFESFRVDKSDFLQYGSGVWNVFAQNRIQLPAIVVEVVPRRQMFGYELGGKTTFHQDVLFHIFTEQPFDRKLAMDIITYQKEKTIPLFDKNLVVANNRFPLDANGSVASGALCFPDLVKPTGQGGFFWQGGTFLQMNTQETISMPPLFQAVVRATMEVNLLIL
jgi:hypothetical protein